MKISKQEFAALFAKAESLKNRQQKELPAVLMHNRAAAIRYDKYAIKIAKFIREEVIPTGDADLMLAVSLTLAKIELNARPKESLLNRSLQNSAEQCAQAIKSRDQNMRDHISFAIAESGYQASQRRPKNPRGVPIDAVHKYAAAERARHSNAQLGRTLAPALLEEAQALVDLCNAILVQHQHEQQALLAKLQN